MSGLVRWEKQDRVAVVTIDRPKALNALNAEVIGAFGGLLDRVEADPASPCRADQARCHGPVAAPACLRAKSNLCRAGSNSSCG